MKKLEAQFDSKIKKSETVGSDPKGKIKTVSELEHPGFKKMGDIRRHHVSQNTLLVPNRLTTPPPDHSSNMYSYESKASNNLIFSAKVMKDSMSYYSKDDQFEKNNYFEDENLLKNSDINLNSTKKIFKNMDTLKEEPEENEVS